jgi:hypothetical protein
MEVADSVTESPKPCASACAPTNSNAANNINQGILEKRNLMFTKRIYSKYLLFGQMAKKCLVSRGVKLGGTVATVGFPDIGLQGFAPKVLAHGHHGGNRLWEVELRPGDDPRYFQISVVFADGHHAAGQMAGRASSAGG